MCPAIRRLRSAHRLCLIDFYSIKPLFTHFSRVFESFHACSVLPAVSLCTTRCPSTTSEAAATPWFFLQFHLQVSRWQHAPWAAAAPVMGSGTSAQTTSRFTFPLIKQNSGHLGLTAPQPCPLSRSSDDTPEKLHSALFFFRARSFCQLSIAG